MNENISEKDLDDAYKIYGSLPDSPSKDEILKALDHPLVGLFLNEVNVRLFYLIKKAFFSFFLQENTMLSFFIRDNRLYIAVIEEDYELDDYVKIPAKIVLDLLEEGKLKIVKIRSDHYRFEKV